MSTKTVQGSLSPYPHQRLLLVVLWITAFLTGVTYLIVVLICITLTISDYVHLLMCLLAIRMSSLGGLVFLRDTLL